jgi:hypothetical protein
MIITHFQSLTEPSNGSHTFLTLAYVVLMGWAQKMWLGWLWVEGGNSSILFLLANISREGEAGKNDMVETQRLNKIFLKLTNYNRLLDVTCT